LGVDVAAPPAQDQPLRLGLVAPVVAGLVERLRQVLEKQAAQVAGQFVLGRAGQPGDLRAGLDRQRPEESKRDRPENEWLHRRHQPSASVPNTGSATYALFPRTSLI